MTKEKIYAPVYIPTLNRYEHFKRCLESLEHCTDADKTDVYVGLDYPPSEKYVEGWKKIDEFLHEKEKENGFKNLYVRRRDHNCGIGKVGSNAGLLLAEIKKKSDRYIATEDDNEFSPNFLEYINWGLECFKDDKSIYAICGFKRVDTSSLKNNVYKYPRFNAWGSGQWFDRREKLDKYRDLSVLKSVLDEMPLWNAFTNKVYKGAAIIHMLNEKRIHGDYLPAFLPEEEQFCLFPKTSMVKNHGHDGSGSHGGNSKTFELYENLEIDDSKEFVPRIVEDLYQSSLKEIYNNTYPIPYKKKLRIFFEFVSFKMTNRIITHEYKDPWYKITIKKI